VKLNDERSGTRCHHRGGIVGTNIAYHLAKLGWTDVVLYEKGEIASGESSHAAGLVTQFATSQTLMQFRKYSIELYSGLGLFDHVGSLRVASTEDQLKELRRSVSRAKPSVWMSRSSRQRKPCALCLT